MLDPSGASSLLCLGKAPNGGLLVRVHLENRVQFCDLQHAMNFFRRIQKFQIATPGLHRYVSASQFPDSCTVHGIHLQEIEDDFSPAPFNEITNGVTKSQTRFTQINTSTQIHNRNRAEVPLIHGQVCHAYPSTRAAGIKFEKCANSSEKAKSVSSCRAILMPQGPLYGKTLYRLITHGLIVLENQVGKAYEAYFRP
jgi:hypothetical protein